MILFSFTSKETVDNMISTWERWDQTTLKNSGHVAMAPQFQEGFSVNTT